MFSINKHILSSGRILMLIGSVVMFILVIVGQSFSLVELRPVMDYLIPDFIDNTESTGALLFINILAVFVYVPLFFVALMPVLLLLSIFNKKCMKILQSILNIYSLVMKPVYKYFLKPFAFIVDKLLASLFLSVFVMMAMSGLGLWKEEVEQVAMTFIASFLLMSAIFYGKPILYKKISNL